MIGPGIPQRLLVPVRMSPCFWEVRKTGAWRAAPDCPGRPPGPHPSQHNSRIGRGLDGKGRGWQPEHPGPDGE